MMARDVFSLVHFPMMCGVVAYAVAVEEAIAHPVDPLPLDGRLALAIGLALFAGGMAVAVWRATRRLLHPRLIITATTVIALVAVNGVAPLITLTIAFVGIAAIAILEQRMITPAADIHS
jgi:low temperature requirement protein LtrA